MFKHERHLSYLKIAKRYVKYILKLMDTFGWGGGVKKILLNMTSL